MDITGHCRFYNRAPYKVRRAEDASYTSIVYTVASAQSSLERADSLRSANIHRCGHTFIQTKSEICDDTEDAARASSIYRRIAINR